MAIICRIRYWPYRAALLFVGAALLASVLLWPLVVRYPLTFFWPAIIFAAWYAGTRSGLLVILLATLLTVILRIDLFNERADAIDYLGLSMFLLTAGFTTWLIARNRKRESALLDNEKRLRIMLDSVPCGVWTVDPNGMIHFRNKFWQEFIDSPSDQPQSGASAVHP